jgi:phospho-N-acetylmuramoyl-pentapeptide-transferase
MPGDLVKVIVPMAAAFWVGIGITPIVTHYLYKYRVWKKRPGKQALDGTEAVEFNRLHQDQEGGTPRMGGIVVWASVLITVVGTWAIARAFPSDVMGKLDFLSRDQTWIPLVALIAGALVGFFNDILDVKDENPRGIPLRIRLIIVGILALFIGWWFYAKLEVVGVGIPGGGVLFLGAFIIPFFMLVTLALYASGVIDGIDGLSGGTFASIFAAYAIVAFEQHQLNLAAFCSTMVGALLAFLWFNIPPARFWMTETGTMGITLTIGVVAFMTDSLGEGIGISVLPIIAGLLVVTVASNILQIASKKFLGRKLFRIAPLHHHFEAVGWPGYKVTMRYWVLGIMLAFLGVIIAIIGR